MGLRLCFLKYLVLPTIRLSLSEVEWTGLANTFDLIDTTYIGLVLDHRKSFSPQFLYIITPMVKGWTIFFSGKSLFYKGSHSTQVSLKSEYGGELWGQSMMRGSDFWRYSSKTLRNHMMLSELQSTWKYKFVWQSHMWIVKANLLFGQSLLYCTSWNNSTKI